MVKALPVPALPTKLKSKTVPSPKVVWNVGDPGSEPPLPRLLYLAFPGNTERSKLALLLDTCVREMKLRSAACDEIAVNSMAAKMDENEIGFISNYYVCERVTLSRLLVI